MTVTKPKGLYPALLAFQEEAPALQKTAINPHFNSKFVSLDVLTEAVTPLLNKHGLIWTALPGHTENGSPTLNYALVHAETGEKLTGAMALLPQKVDPQGQGSAITYARRYALMAVLSLVADEDDDGNEASKKSSPNLALNKEQFEEKLADKVAALPGSKELANKTQLTKLGKARELLGATRFDSYLRSCGADKPEDLTKDEAESVLTWARNQAKQKAA